MARYEVTVLTELVGLDRSVLVQVFERRLVTANAVDDKEVELDEAQLARLRRIRRLMEDFDLNFEALELVLALRDEVEQLRRRLDESDTV